MRVHCESIDDYLFPVARNRCVDTTPGNPIAAVSQRRRRREGVPKRIGCRHAFRRYAATCVPAVDYVGTNYKRANEFWKTGKKIESERRANDPCCSENVLLCGNFPRKPRTGPRRTARRPLKRGQPRVLWEISPPKPPPSRYRDGPSIFHPAPQPVIRQINLARGLWRSHVPYRNPIYYYHHFSPVRFARSAARVNLTTAARTPLLPGVFFFFFPQNFQRQKYIRTYTCSSLSSLPITAGR